MRLIAEQKDVAETTRLFMKGKQKWTREDLLEHVQGALENEPNEVLIRILLEIGYIE